MIYIIFSDTAASECKECDIGTYSGSDTGYTSATQCAVCQRGRFRIAGYDSGKSCNVCPPGTYLPNSGGSYENDRSLHDEEADCLPCEVGKYSDTKGSYLCTTCDMGKFQDSTRQTSCKSCPKGKFNPHSTSVAASYHDSSDDCEVCDNGYYAEEDGSSECTACVASKFLSDVGITD